MSDLNYAAFKTYLASFLWRDGDAVLLNALDALITMAEAELQRALKVQDNQNMVILAFVGSPVPLPDDYRTLDQLFDSAGQYEYLTPGLFSERACSGTLDQRAFTIIGRSLWLTGIPGLGDPNLWSLVGANWDSIELTTWDQVTSAPPANPHNVNLIYYRKLPSYKTTDASWVADLHLDLFTYAVLMHAGRFVRDDDRVPGWVEAYGAALASVTAEDAPNRYGRGAPLRIRFGGRHG